MIQTVPVVYGPAVAHRFNIRQCYPIGIFALFWYNGRSVKRVDIAVILFYCRASIIFENASYTAMLLKCVVRDYVRWSGLAPVIKLYCFCFSWPSR